MFKENVIYYLKCLKRADLLGALKNIFCSLDDQSYNFVKIDCTFEAEDCSVSSQSFLRSHGLAQQLHKISNVIR